VTDGGTGLVWQRTPSDASYTWSEAQAHCEALDLDGGGFRVPSVKELQTLIDEAKTESPYLDEDAFPGTPAGRLLFWTSSRSASVVTAAWFVNFGTGEAADAAAVIGNIEDMENRVRCVR
jgi:hypothetical protein